MTITPFPGPIARLEDRTRSQLDALLNPQQQTVARFNLRLDRPKFEPPLPFSELRFFGWGKDGARIEIWRVGAWSHWKVQTRGREDSSRAPQLPEAYRRFWKEPATDNVQKAPD